MRPKYTTPRRLRSAQSARPFQVRNMGSEASSLHRDIQVDKPAIETTNFWTQYNAELLHDGIATTASSTPANSASSAGPGLSGNGNDDHLRSISSTPVSMFQGEPVVAQWSNTTPLERSARNLMVYRHPSILKFIKSSCTPSTSTGSNTSRGSKTFLVTERCRPLSADELTKQSDLQTRLGLRSVLCALQFLVERASARHLNVSMPVVYVTPSGAWRLGGFELVWLAADVTQLTLEMVRPFRCRRSVDENGERRTVMAQNAEQYAFGVLCEEVLKTRQTDEGE